MTEWRSGLGGFLGTLLGPGASGLEVWRPPGGSLNSERSRCLPAKVRGLIVALAQLLHPLWLLKLLGNSLLLPAITVGEIVFEDLNVLQLVHQLFLLGRYFNGGGLGDCLDSSRLQLKRLVGLVCGGERWLLEGQSLRFVNVGG